MYARGLCCQKMGRTPSCPLRVPDGVKDQGMERGTWVWKHGDTHGHMNTNVAIHEATHARVQSLPYMLAHSRVIRTHRGTISTTCSQECALMMAAKWRACSDRSMPSCWTSGAMMQKAGRSSAPARVKLAYEVKSKKVVVPAVQYLTLASRATSDSIHMAACVGCKQFCMCMHAIKRIGTVCPSLTLVSGLTVALTLPIPHSPMTRQ